MNHYSYIEKLRRRRRNRFRCASVKDTIFVPPLLQCQQTIQPPKHQTRRSKHRRNLKQTGSKKPLQNQNTKSQYQFNGQQRKEADGFVYFENNDKPCWQYEDDDDDYINMSENIQNMGKEKTFKLTFENICEIF